MLNVTVRSATIEDLDALHYVLGYLHDRPPWSEDRADQAKQALKAIVNDSARGLHLALVDGHPAGTIDVVVATNLTRDLRPFAVIENVMVVPEFRRNGLGRRLMQAALSFAEEQDCYKVQLVSANKRDAAHYLYAAMGFDADVSGYRQYLVPME
jgi:GNAT superfamily N-acetyltransferase